MMNRPIQGTIVAARLTRSAFGQHVYEDFTLRADGREERVGRIIVSASFSDIMAPGVRGRFHLHDIVGARGLHGFQSLDGAVRLAFPRLIETVLGILAFFNIGMVVGGIALDGELRLVPLLIGSIGVAAWATFRASREAIVNAFRFEVGLTRAADGARPQRSAAQRPRHQLM